MSGFIKIGKMNFYVSMITVILATRISGEHVEFEFNINWSHKLII